MDYFHADRRPVWRRSPGPDAFLRRAIPVHGLRPADLPGKPAHIETCLSVHGNSITWASASRSGARRWPMPTKGATGVSMRRGPGLITQARTLRRRRTGVGRPYRLRLSTTIALCLSVFPWAHFRTTKAAVKMHTLLDLRGNIPSFIQGWQAARRSCPRYAPEAGAIYVVDRGYADFARLYVLHQAGAFFVTRASEHRCSSRLFGADGSLDRHHLRRPSPGRLLHVRITPNFWAHRFKDPESGKTLVFITNNFSLPAATICALYKSRWQVELFFKWIKQHLRP